VNFVVFDIETAGLGPTAVMDRIGLGTSEGTWTLPWSAGARDFSRTLLSDPGRVKVAHNIQFDEAHLRRNGVVVAQPWWDTLIAGHLIEADMLKSLRSMVPLYLDAHPFKHKAESDPEWYNAADVCHERALHLVQRDILEREGMLDYFQNTIMPGVPVLIYQHELGLTVDVPERDRLRNSLVDYLADSIRVWHDLTNVNHRSNQDVAALLYTTLGLPVQRNKDTKAPAVDVEALEALRGAAPAHSQLIDALLEVRRTEKLLSTYIDMDGAASGCVHASFLPGVKDDESESSGKGAASTGRLGASPNLNNVPGDWKHRGQRVSESQAATLKAQGAKVLPPMRLMFVPRAKGHVFLELDYQQLELRIIAARSGCADLARALDGDVHEVTRLAIERVSGAPCSRVLAKGYAYATWYGGKEQGLVNLLRSRGITISRAQARAGQQGIARAYPKAWAWKEAVERRVVADGYLTDPFGRKRHFYGGSRDVTEGVNYIPQATGASMLWSQLPGQRELADAHGAFFPLTMHDSYLHEVPLEGVNEYHAKLKGLLEREYNEVAPGWHVPTTAKVGRSWGAMEALT
jgi:DNA polymerase-1